MLLGSRGNKDNDQELCKDPGAHPQHASTQSMSARGVNEDAYFRGGRLDCKLHDGKRKECAIRLWRIYREWSLLYSVCANVCVCVG